MSGRDSNPISASNATHCQKRHHGVPRQPSESHSLMMVNGLSHFGSGGRLYPELAHRREGAAMVAARPIAPQGVVVPGRAVTLVACEAVGGEERIEGRHD